MRPYKTMPGLKAGNVRSNLVRMLRWTKSWEAGDEVTKSPGVLSTCTCVSVFTDVEALGELVGEWEKVTVFFLLRLALAPCVESLVLLDRVLFLQEQGIRSLLTPCIPFLSDGLE